MIQNKADEDIIVYVTEKFQPYSETFDKVHYYFAGPLVLFPVTAEQQIVAQIVAEFGAGIILNKKQAASPKGINELVMKALKDEILLKKAEEMRADFLNSPGPKGAADFIEALFIHSTSK